MLDAETKRKIDNCRDILVGKIPDPKSQVEQITIALIYKFMDDMDQLSIYQGGKPSFFRGDFEKYSWSSIFNPRISGFELLNLYGEALVKMNHNPNIPQLFRDIFKNAFLPYRDPETLRLFLKEIGGFSYEHSERLGDAFEYLLSVLSSQGKAGQFRTPRHIIDFIVKIIDPKLNQTILDPACGTAGFLISAYKHIKNNRKLSTTQKNRLMNNFVGYDISADMVRLSLANMYLHGFAYPKIHEYDTLTYEDKWNDTFDVIMANPPFMTPKGGIRPHSRFSIKAKRSEVLFVDYIAEHLNPGGRAGVIVPEGIIFQSQNAYKALRKMLVESYLWAVVSLPAGIFNPYSGVKTSILLMDKSLAKRIDRILFVKIENDGYDLGAQRRPIDPNDLPAAQKYLNIYKLKIENYKTKIEDSLFAHVVQKSEIAKSGDYNLSGDRYREFFRHPKGSYDVVELKELCDFSNGLWKGKNPPFKKVPILRSTNFQSDGFLNIEDIAVHEVETRELQKKILRYGDILIEKSGGGPDQPVGRVVFFDLREGKYSYSNFTSRIRVRTDRIIPKFLFLILRHLYYLGSTENLQKRTSGIRNLDLKAYQNLKIPIPPIEVQEKNVAEIDGYKKIIDAARQIVQSYKPTIKTNQNWPTFELGEVLILQRGHDLPKKSFRKGNFPVVGSNGVIGYHDTYKYKGPGVITGRSGTIGQVHYIEENYWPHNTALFVKDFRGNHPKFIFYLLQSVTLNLKNLGERTSAVPSLDRKNAHRIKVQLPPLDEQKQIVAQIQGEQKIVNENKKLIEIFEQKIKDKIAEIWGES